MLIPSPDTALIVPPDVLLASDQEQISALHVKLSIMEPPTTFNFTQLHVLLIAESGGLESIIDVKIVLLNAAVVLPQQPVQVVRVSMDLLTSLKEQAV